MEEAVAAMGAPGAVAEAILDGLPAVPRAIAKTRRRSTALLWVLAIAGSPVWLPLLLAFAVIAITVYLCIWILALCVWIVTVAIGGVGVVELVFAVSGVVIGHVPYVLASAGVGLAFLGAALLMGAGAWDRLQADCAPFGALGRKRRFRRSGTTAAKERTADSPAATGERLRSASKRWGAHRPRHAPRHIK